MKAVTPLHLNIAIVAFEMFFFQILIQSFVILLCQKGIN